MNNRENGLERPRGESPSLEKSPSLPAGFADLREKINTLVQKPLEERFAKNPEELERLTSVPEEMIQTFIKNFPAENEGKEPDNADVEKYKQGAVKRRAGTLFESELMELLTDLSLLPQNNNHSAENDVFEEPFECVNEECLEKTDLVKSVYNGHDPRNLSGDHFRITRKKTNGTTQTDVLLIDAEGHGGGAKPLALLADSFLAVAEKEKLEHPLILLDGFISSLPLNRSEISLQRASIQNREGEGAKTLSLTQAGEAYVFWVEGDKEAGWKMKIIMPESNEKHEAIDTLALEEGSQMGNIGYGTFERTAKKWGIVPHAQTFAIPKDASIFFSSDGIFDSKNPEDEKRLAEELPKIITRVFRTNGGKDRRELEEILFQEIKKVAQTYMKTDDETFLKITA